MMTPQNEKTSLPPVSTKSGGIWDSGMKFLACSSAEDTDAVLWDSTLGVDSIPTQSERIADLEAKVEELAALVTKGHGHEGGAKHRHGHEKKHGRGRGREGGDVERGDVDPEADDGGGDAGSARSSRSSIKIINAINKITGLRIDTDRAPRKSIFGEDRENLLASIQEHLELSAFGSFYCYTQFRLVHTRFTGRLVFNTACAYGAALLQCYILVTVLDTKFIHFDNRHVDGGNFQKASKFYKENPYRAGAETPSNWYALTRHGHFSGVPCIVTGPLFFGSLMIALSLRSELHELIVGSLLVVPRREELASCRTRREKTEWVLAHVSAYGIHIMRCVLIFLYLQATMCVLGTSNGPFEILLDCLTLMFILELDNLIKLDSKHTLFGRAGRASGREKVLSRKLRTIATSVIDAGTVGRKAEANVENFLVCSLAAYMTVGTFRMQRITSRGRVTMSDDPNHHGMVNIFWQMQYAMIGTVVTLVVFARRFALRLDAIYTIGLYLYDLFAVLITNYFVADCLLSYVGVYGDTSIAYKFTLKSILRGLNPNGRNNDDGYVQDDGLFLSSESAQSGPGDTGKGS